MTSRINYSLLFMLIKIKVQKRDKFFSYKTSSFFSSPSLWNKRSSHDVFSPKTSLPNTRANNLFSKKENNQGVARFQKQIVLDSHRNNFLFSKCKIKISRSILDPYSFTKLKKKEMRDWFFKTIICLSRWHTTLGGNDQYKGATLCLEEMVISFNKTRGHFCFTNWSFQQVTPNVFRVRRGVMNNPLKLFDNSENL